MTYPEFGWLTIHKSGETLRPATAEEWQRTADAVLAGNQEGTWRDEDGTVVYVDGGPDMEDEQARQCEETS